MKNSHPRPPVVVVLGHVDHGKTTLLDYIRKTNKAAKETGGITQSIGAYEAHIDKTGYQTDRITFIDTPGHEAFSSLRARGALLADIAVLVIDAVDSVMPQTREAIAHIKSAEIPYIIAINKIDRPGANIERVKKDLLKEDIQLDEFGGKIVAVPISAKTGVGVGDLLEAILFVSSARNFTYDEKGAPEIYVLEVQYSKAGPTVSAIIKNGTLSVGTTLYAGSKATKVRALIDNNGKSLLKVTPSAPFVILGFKELPEVGTKLTLDKVDLQEKKTVNEPVKTTEGFFKSDDKKLSIVLKADSQGSLEAVIDRLSKQEGIMIVFSGVGELSKSDLLLAKVSKAVIVGFNVIPSKDILALADQEKVVIKTYKIIYELIEELEEVSDLIEAAEAKKKSLKGEAKLKAVFVIGEANIAGVEVTLGKVSVGDKIELYRATKLIGEGKITSIKKQAQVAPELKRGEEGGLAFDSGLDFRAGDMIKSYSI